MPQIIDLTYLRNVFDGRQDLDVSSLLSLRTFLVSQNELNELTGLAADLFISKSTMDEGVLAHLKALIFDAIDSDNELKIYFASAVLVHLLAGWNCALELLDIAELGLHKQNDETYRDLISPCTFIIGASAFAGLGVHLSDFLGHVDKWRSQRRIDVMSMKPRKLSAVLS